VVDNPVGWDFRDQFSKGHVGLGFNDASIVRHPGSHLELKKIFFFVKIAAWLAKFVEHES